MRKTDRQFILFPGRYGMWLVLCLVPLAVVALGLCTALGALDGIVADSPPIPSSERMAPALVAGPMVWRHRFEIGLDLRFSFPGQVAHAVIVDVRDQGRVNRVVEEHRPDVIFHAAAIRGRAFYLDFNRQGRQPDQCHGRDETIG
jgi:hypothetical protein